MSRAIVVEELWGGLTDNSGEPLAGGKVYVYEPGTTTPKTLYSASDKSSNHANPVILDAYGRKQAWADGSYKFVVKTSADVTLYTLDNLLYGITDNDEAYGGTATGSPNAYAVSPSPALTAYSNGQEVFFIANFTNTAAPTLNVNSLGAKSIVSATGATLLAGDIQNDQLCHCRYDSSGSGQFRLINKSTGTSTSTISNCGTSTGSSNAYTINPSVAPTALNDGDAYLFIPNHTNSSVATLVVGTLTAKPIRLYGNVPLNPFDLISNYPAIVQYDATNDVYFLLNRIGFDCLIPRAGCRIFEDFLMGISTSGSIGALGWVSAVSGSGAEVENWGTYNTVPAITNHPGIIALDRGTTTTGRAALYLNGNQLFFSGGRVLFETSVHIPNLSTAPDEYSLRIGLGDSVSADHADGAYFEHDQTTGYWKIKTASNSTRTTTTTTILVADGVWIRLTIAANEDGTSLEFFVDGVSAGTITTNIPTAYTRVCAPIFSIIGSAGTNSRRLLVDYVDFKKMFSTIR